jgi:hypothetical protein
MFYLFLVYLMVGINAGCSPPNISLKIFTVAWLRTLYLVYFHQTSWFNLIFSPNVMVQWSTVLYIPKVLVSVLGPEAYVLTGFMYIP